jgi:hypothetical protein
MERPECRNVSEPAISTIERQILVKETEVKPFILRIDYESKNDGRLGDWLINLGLR